MPLGPRELLLGVIVPALAAIVVLFIARRAWLRRGRDTTPPVTPDAAEHVEYQSRDVQWREYVQSVGAWGGPLAAGIAWAIAFPTIAGTFNIIPPRESMSYLFLAVIACTIGGVIDSRTRSREDGGSIGLRIAGVFVLAVACAAGVLRFKFRSDWTPSHASTTLLAVGAVCLIWWLAMDAAERDPTSTSAMPWIAWMICVTISVTLMMNGSIKYGQLALALAAAAGAGVLLTLTANRRIFVRGTAVVFAIVPTLIIISAHYLFDLKPLYVALLLSAPITIALGRVIPTAHLRSSVRGVLRIAPTALLMAIILTIVVREFRKANAERDPDDPYAMLHEVSRQPFGSGLA